jgi:phosphohistidine phosphatase SixA
MKKLLLLRHAKAVSHDEKHDKARALNSRGRSDSESMGRVMHREQYLPDLVFCSTARRTVETWEHLAPELKCNSDFSTSSMTRLPPQSLLVPAAPRAARAPC